MEEAEQVKRSEGPEEMISSLKTVIKNLERRLAEAEKRKELELHENRVKSDFIDQLIEALKS